MLVRRTCAAKMGLLWVKCEEPNLSECASAMALLSGLNAVRDSADRPTRTSTAHLVLISPRVEALIF
jgi:hypothetical protein